jgi:predicted RNA binding protein YcfA (HicA-like mRNA interferase family)
MPRLKVLSGQDVIAVLAIFGFVEESRRGSHVKLRRTGPSGERQMLIVPNHTELAKGTLRAIYRQSLKYIYEEKLNPYFYSE